MTKTIEMPLKETLQQESRKTENSLTLPRKTSANGETDPIPPQEGLISSRVATLRTGMGKFTFFRAVKACCMTPVVDNKARFWFTEVQVQELTRYAGQEKHHGGRPKGKLDQAEASALAFMAFEEGMSPQKVVIFYRMPPYLVKQLHQAWMELSDGFVVTGADRKAIEGFPWKKKVFEAQNRSVTTAKELLDLLRNQFQSHV